DGSLLATLAAITPHIDTLTENSVNTANLMDGSVTASKIAPGSVVKSINSLRDDVNLVPGTNVTITPRGNALIIDAVAVTGKAGSTGLGLVWQGPWSSSTGYSINDAVQYNGASYISIQAGSNHEPDTSPTFWSLLADRGATGPTGPIGFPG